MSVSKRIKHFKQLAILLSIFWTLLTSCFVIYQFYNEEKHIEESSLEKIKGVAEQSVAFIYWAYEQKANALNDEQKYAIRSNFSLKELLAVLAKHSDMEFDISTSTKILNLSPSALDTVLKVKERKEDGYIVFEKTGEKHLFYVKPMLANRACISCHVHHENTVGSLMGYTTLMMKVPTFKKANPQTFYFLVVTYLGTWLLGLFAIWWIHARGRDYLNEKTKMYEESMYALVDMMEKRDSYTAGHSQRVAEYAKMIVLAMNYSSDEADFIYKAGMLHDIGKIEIPDAILLKPDKLTEIEYSLIKRHVRASYELLSREPFILLAEVVLSHHERYDGGGYPQGLKAEQIPFFSQIIAVADAFDAMTTNRAYRKSLSREAALAVLNEERGKQFHPLIVDVAQEIFAQAILPENTTQMPKDLLEEMRFSYSFRDQLTGFYNVNYLKFVFNHTHDYALKVFQIDHLNCTDFALYNKKQGWKKGDELLCLIAKTISSLCPEAIIVRVHSDNFLVLHVNENEPIDYATIDVLMREHGLVMQYQHVSFGIDERLSVETLEDKLLHL
jgi:HD-GYP domain-containing protein (c-di-GMP phosphodiesterase class II)